MNTGKFEVMEFDILIKNHMMKVAFILLRFCPSQTTCVVDVDAFAGNTSL